MVLLGRKIAVVSKGAYQTRTWEWLEESVLTGHELEEGCAVKSFVSESF